MDKITNLLLTELANSLNISPKEVESKFTEEQLKEDYAISFCEQYDEIGQAFSSLDEIECLDPKPLPLPEINLQDLEKNIQELEKNQLPDSTQKCINSVELLTYELNSERESYLKYTALYERLVEYRDNFEPISYYFEERSKELDRILQASSAGQEKSIPIFSNQYFIKVKSSPPNELARTLKDLYKNYLDPNLTSKIQEAFSNYSQCIQVKETSPPTSISQAINNSFFNFKIFFPTLNSFKLEVQTFNSNSQESLTKKIDFPIKNNPLLEKQSFFENSSALKVDELKNLGGLPITGKLYQDYYNLLSDPINNFFTLDDKGLTSEATLVDPRVKGTLSEKKRENSSEYFVKDLDKLQQFYQNFEQTLENKKSQVRSQVIDHNKLNFRETFKIIAQREIQILFALGRINKSSESSSSLPLGIINEIRSQNLRILSAFTDLNSEIERLKIQLNRLKPTPNVIRQRLKEKSPECFEKIDDPSDECPDINEKLGTDPLYLKTIKKGVDPTLPCATQLCYWKQFSVIANKVGLLPIPNLPDFNQLRYWPVGLAIPTPAGLVKIPLPVIWIPLTTISTPMGTLVFFLTINGIFITPVIFFISSTGFKRHLFTVRGASPKFGFTAEEESIKPGIQKSVALLARIEKEKRLAQEKILGPLFNLSLTQKQQYAQQKNILDVAEEAADSNNNENKKLKVAREKKNLEESVSSKGQYERLQEILDKKESAKDAISEAKQSVFAKIDSLGKPTMPNSQRLKNKIIERRERILKDIQRGLVEGDQEKVDRLRKESQSDAVDINEKISAIEKDLFSYFELITLPKITIPKDSSKIEPKPNSIIDFLYEILDFSRIYRSSFASPESLRINSLFKLELAKKKDEIDEISQNTSSQLDVEKDLGTIKKFLLDVNKLLVDGLSGNTGSSQDPNAAFNKVNEYREQRAKEKDPNRQKQLDQKIKDAQIKFSKAFDDSRVKEALSLTPAALLSLSQIKIDYNPFSPCCPKKPFELDLSSLSPVIPVLTSVQLLLETYINQLDSQSILKLTGGKKTLSSRELKSVYLSSLKNAIPKELSIPLPAYNLLTFSASFSGILLSLLEIRVQNPAAAPFSIPKRITLDLDIVKPILRTALMAFFKNSIPKESSSPIVTNQNFSQAQAQPSVLNQVKESKDFLIVGCEPDTSSQSAISSGIFKPANQSERVPNPFILSSGNLVQLSDNDMLPSFSTLAFDFLSINPSDLLAILKNFIQLGFDVAEKTLDQFYKTLDLILSVKGIKLNSLEAAQYSIPSVTPASPPYLPTFTALTLIKSKTNKSVDFKIIDIEEAEKKTALIEKTLGPIANSPLPALLVVAAGLSDRVVAKVPIPAIPKLDAENLSISSTDQTLPSYQLIRSLHPIISQDDIPPWERLSEKNPLFLLFIDQFLSSGADKLGFFRNYL